MPKKTDKNTIKHTVRIYDDELLTYIDDLFKIGVFPSRNAVINKAIEYGIPLLYKNLIGKNIKGLGLLAPESNVEKDVLLANRLKELALTVDDIFVVLNILEYLTSTIYNIELARVMNVNVTDDQVRSGLLSDLPENLQSVKDEIIAKHTKKRGNR